MPEQAPTVQAAINARVDTVLIRPGIYFEAPVVSQPISLQGLSNEAAELPVLAGLTVRVGRTSDFPRLFDFQRLQFDTRVLIVSDYGACDFNFAYCSLRDGIADDSQFMDTQDIILRKCSLNGSAELMGRGEIRLDSCLVTGHVYVCGADPGLIVRSCDFQGDGTGFGLSSCRLGGAWVEGNTFRAYGLAVSVGGDAAVVSDNQIEDCSGAIGASGGRVTVRNNSVRQFGSGIAVGSPNSISVSDNILIGGTGNGIYVTEASDLEIVRNVIVACGGEGVWITDQSARLFVRVVNNTSGLNGGSGFVWENSYDPPFYGVEWKSNIGFRNAGFGLRWASADLGAVSCNDWYGNLSGDVWGRPSTGDDFAIDPQFCDPDGEDFRLNSTSPLVDWPGCGLVGALGIGCGETPVLVQRFTADRASDGIRIVWQVVSDGAASEIRLERSESKDGRGWIRPLTERSLEGGVVVEFDRSALSEKAYWYRLVALEESGVTVIGPPIGVEARPEPEFRLVEVGPSPGGGPLRIAFSLEITAAIEIDVFDIQGRRVASPGRGSWSQGAHQVMWDGRTPSGAPVPAGLYVVRYAYPGGRDRRAIVRVR